MKGAEYLVQQLQAWDVPFLSVLCGNGLDPLLQAADAFGLRVVDTRNEQAASYIADAYARLTGKLGVCAVSSGIAHVNALAGVVNAYYDGAPLLLITGASDSRGLGRGAFQDLDQVALAQPVCKFSRLVTRSEHLPSALREAVGLATSGRPGPVHLTISTDALSGSVGNVPPPQPGLAVARPASTIPPDALITQAVEMLRRAQRPLIVAGSGLFYADAEDALASLSEEARIPVVTPIWDRGVVGRAGETFLGVVGAASGEPELLAQADLVVLVGARVDYRLRYLDAPPLRSDLRTIRISADPAELGQGVTPDLTLLADPAAALGCLVRAWREGGYTGHDGWLREARERHGAFYGRWATPPDRPPLLGWHVVEALRPLLGEEVVFLIDGGNIGQWAHMLLCRDRYPAHWLTCGASAVVGWGVPGAMAARLAFPDRPVLLLSGDGALGFGLAEFESAARQGLAFAAVVADDRAWGIVVSGQQAACGRTVASVLAAVDYAAAARALGADGRQVTTPEGLTRAVAQALTAERATLLQVVVAGGGPADRRGG